MVVKVTKHEKHISEHVHKIDKPSGIAGEAMLRANTVQEQQALIGVGRRNLIINGNMIIAQRGPYTGSNGFGLDRWRNSENTGGQTTMTRQIGGPYTEDGYFKYYLQVNVDTPDTSLAATEYAGVFYKVEGHDFDCAAYGSDGARTLTLSFWHCHSQPGIYSISMRNDGGGSNRNYVLNYRQDLANVWQKTVITFPGDTGGNWTTTNTPALSIFWTFAQGTQYATNTLNQWFGGTYYHASTSIINMMATTNAKFRLTGVQLELGNTATPFEHRSFGEELSLCQRYYTMLAGGADYAEEYGGGSSHILGTMHKWNTTNTFIFTDLPTNMRDSASMTLVKSGGSADFAFKAAGYTSTGNDLTLDGDSSGRHIRINSAVTNGSWPAGCSGWVRCNTTSAFCAIDNEM